MLEAIVGGIVVLAAGWIGRNLWHRGFGVRDVEVHANLEAPPDLGPPEITFENTGKARLGPIRCIVVAPDGSSEARRLSSEADQRWRCRLGEDFGSKILDRREGNAVTIITCGEGAVSRRNRYYFLRSWVISDSSDETTPSSSKVIRSPQYPSDAGLIEAMNLRAVVPADGVASENGTEADAETLLDALHSDGRSMNAGPLRTRLGFDEERWDAATRLLEGRSEISVSGQRLSRVQSTKPPDAAVESVKDCLPRDGSRISGPSIIAMTIWSEDETRAALRELINRGEAVGFRGRGGLYARVGGQAQVDSVRASLPADGSRITGPDLRRKSGLSEPEFRAALATLKEQGAIKSHRGRGGSYETVL